MNNAVTAIIVSIIQKTAKLTRPIHASESLSSLGLSSMQMVQLTMRLEEYFGQEISVEHMAKVEKIHDLAKLITTQECAHETA